LLDVGPERPALACCAWTIITEYGRGVQHLAALGHRDIAFVTGPLRLHSAHSRLAAFHRAVQECGIVVD